jgi:hypothetical protein
MPLLITYLIRYDLIKHDEVDQSMIRYEHVDQGLSSLTHMIKVITYDQGGHICSR